MCIDKERFFFMLVLLGDCFLMCGLFLHRGTYWVTRGSDWRQMGVSWVTERSVL